MPKYKSSDIFRRTSKEINVNKHTPEHIERWNWIGNEGKSYKEISAPDSGYRRTLFKEQEYQGNQSSIDHHLTYDINSRGMVQKLKSNKKLIFGEIDGVTTHQVFSDRTELAKSGIHRPTMGGIEGRGSEGSCSIVLSGGYEDDIDNLDYILYTGQGGRDANSGKQIANQEFTRGNQGLVLSKDYGLPVRVTRGFQVKNGPSKGYRYDGLYYVTQYERVKGKSGFFICRFHLESEKSIKKIEEGLGGSLPQDYEPTDRSKTTVNRLNRNIKLAEIIKKMYDYRCQVCGIYLKKPNGAIAIGAHIRGLGRPHDGPDTINNMLCLCPNHHDQFDASAFYIDPSNMEIVGLDQFENKQLHVEPKHDIGTNFLSYQKDRYEIANGLYSK